MIPTGTHDPLAPLRHFHALPEVRYVTPETLPNGVRSLLAHDGDMTSRLARAYGSEIHLQVVKHRITDSVLAREVVLKTSSDEPVEYGAIEIFLQNLAPDVKAAVVLQSEPFGGILNRSGTGYYSAPSAYFTLSSTRLPYPAFASAGECFARCNVLRDFDGRELARIVEVLSPLAVSLVPHVVARPPFSCERYDSIYLGASVSNCVSAAMESTAGKAVLLLETSCLTAPSVDDAPDQIAASAPDVFGLALKARRAGVEVHEGIHFCAVSDSELTATARDGSIHRLRGAIRVLTN